MPSGLDGEDLNLIYRTLGGPYDNVSGSGWSVYKGGNREIFVGEKTYICGEIESGATSGSSDINQFIDQNVILIDETPGHESILIKTNKSDYIEIDVTNRKLNIKFKDDIKIETEKDLKIKVGRDFYMDIGRDSYRRMCGRTHTTTCGAPPLNILEPEKPTGERG